ncbi:hypothetical protein NE237_001324 [Protea cynaroides]|uniref:Uncharacterized protein n=1 Tax=Protea cynaroides TaxID=273540 RepID=A0A9Q0KSW0_9MAGN|nr:hypothetical protein NE237_001324 [Protea cynaroides]
MVGLPHNCRAIMQRANPPGIGTLTEKELLDRLKVGVFLDQNKKKYWIDPNNYNCFMVFARDFTITFGRDKRYWDWDSFQETSKVFIEIVFLVKVMWLDVRGEIETSDLTPDVMYEVVFVMSLKDAASGWNIPVNLKLILPDGTKLERQEDFSSKPKKQILETVVGEFKTYQGMQGKIKFSLWEIKGEKIKLWKTGLVIKGAIIRPK